MRIFANDPYENFGGKPEFIKEMEEQSIYGFKNIWNFLYNYKDKDKISIENNQNRS